MKPKPKEQKMPEEPEEPEVSTVMKTKKKVVTNGIVTSVLKQSFICHHQKMNGISNSKFNFIKISCFSFLFVFFLLCVCVCVPKLFELLWLFLGGGGFEIGRAWGRERVYGDV